MDQTAMRTDNWDASLVMRANELLVEIRRYHVDAEATRLQLVSVATSMTRRIDELPGTVRHVVEESLSQDFLTSERSVIVQRIDRSSRKLDDLANLFNTEGSSFLRRSKRVSMFFIFAGFFILIASTAWAMFNGAKALKLSNEMVEMRKNIEHLRISGDPTPIKWCIDSSSRPRLCVRIDESHGKLKDSYYFVQQ